LIVDHIEFAKKIARMKTADHCFDIAFELARNDDTALSDHVEHIASVPFPKHHFLSRAGQEMDVVGKLFDFGCRPIRKQRDSLQRTYAFLDLIFTQRLWRMGDPNSNASCGLSVGGGGEPNTCTSRPAMGKRGGAVGQVDPFVVGQRFAGFSLSKGFETFTRDPARMFT